MRDEFGIFARSGGRLPLSPSQLPALTAADELHVAIGDLDANGGGHLHGRGLTGKTEFPDRWSDDLLDRLDRAMHSPTSARVAADGTEVDLYSLIDDVLVFTVLRRRSNGSWRFVTAFPLCGRGVVHNGPDGPVEKPLDVSDIDRYPA